MYSAVTTYLAKPTTNICLTFGMSIGRACTLTVLYNLNMRKTTGHYLSAGETGAHTVGAAHGSGQSMPLESGFHFTQGATTGSKTAINGISVHSVTHIDGKGGDDGSYDGKRELV